MATAIVWPLWFGHSLPRAVGWETYQQWPESDATLDPLSVLCTLLMFACAVIRIIMLWIGVCQLRCLGVGSSWRLGPLLHAVAFVALWRRYWLRCCLDEVPQDEDDAEQAHSLKMAVVLPEHFGGFTIKIQRISGNTGTPYSDRGDNFDDTAATLYWNPIHRALSPVTKSAALRKRFNIAGKRQGDTTRIFRSWSPVFIRTRKSDSLCV